MSILDDFTYLNRFVPKYPDDTDYNTNSPSYYEYLSKLNKVMKILIQKIYDYDKELAKRFEEWDKNLQDFPDDVKDLLVKWLNDGTLAQIINDEVLGNKADKTDLIRLENDLKSMIENLTTQLSQKANFDEISKTLKIARDTKGFGDNGAVASVIANHDNPTAQVINFKHPTDASAYQHRDSVALYVSAEGSVPVEVHSNVMYGTDYIEFTDSIDLSTLEEGMMCDTLHSPRFTTWIKSVDTENKRVYVESGWYKVVQGTGSATPEVPQNGIGCQFNLITKVWGLNNNIFLRKDDKTELAVAEEIGLFNMKENGIMNGFDLINMTDIMANYGYIARAREGFGFRQAFRSERNEIGFMHTSINETDQALRSSLNGDADDQGYHILSNGRSSKLRLYTETIGNGKTSISSPRNKIYLVTKTTPEEVSFPSPENRSGEVLFINNIGSATTTFRPQNSKQVIFNGIPRGTLPLIPKSQCMLISDGATWIVISHSATIPDFSTESRPTGTKQVGTCIWDSTLLKPIYWSGTDWRDATGSVV